MPPLLQVDVSIGYPEKPDMLRGVKLELQESEILGLAGGSGEGKSSLVLAILGLLGMKGGRCQGKIVFAGGDLLQLGHRALRSYRGKRIGLVPQSPMAALNPNLRLGAQLREAWRAHESGEPDWLPLLASVQLPADERFLRLFPRNLSVGMAQRFLIAMAIMHKPSLLLADEPTSALDLVTQSEILELFRHLNRELGTAVLYVSHDLASMASLCHRAAILHGGEIVESGPISEIFAHPRHTYTRRLVAAIPSYAGPSNHDAKLLV